MLNVETIINGTTALINAKGRGDSATSDIIFEEFENAMKKGCDTFEFNLKGVEYICSSTLRAFLKAQKLCNANGYEMKITEASEGVKDVFEITGYASIMTII